LGELEKIATHYGIIRHGKMIKEMTAEEFENECRTFVGLKAKDIRLTKEVLLNKFNRVEIDEKEFVRIYDETTPEEVVEYLYQKGIIISEIKVDKVGLEEYYIDLMEEGVR
jgi:ABC-2 type transport system ATP-binding protein